MNDLLQESVFFGLMLSIFAYAVALKIRKRFDYPLVNPLLFASVIIIAILLVCNISYETYNLGAQYITFFLTPTTVCLAIPLYKQLTLLRKHLVAVLVSIFSGCLAHLVSVICLAWLFDLQERLMLSTLSKSVTTPIAIAVTEEMGGDPTITILGVLIAGVSGAVLGPTILKLFRIKEPIAQGLAIGTSSHAIGTSRMIEMGEVQGAMSSLSIVVAGILTVVIVPIVVQYL